MNASPFYNANYENTVMYLEQQFALCCVGAVPWPMSFTKQISKEYLEAIRDLAPRCNNLNYITERIRCMPLRLTDRGDVEYPLDEMVYIEESEAEDVYANMQKSLDILESVKRGILHIVD